MCELCDDDRVSVVIMGEMPADEPDNTAMIARDLSDCAERLSALAAKLGPNFHMLHYAAGTIAGMADMLEMM